MARPKSLFRLALILNFMLTQTVSVPKPLEGCQANEQAALLSFKEGLEDPKNRLSSWRGKYCCAWTGVMCSNKTGHVVKLDLANTKLDKYGFHDDDYALSGKLSSSLLGLRHLKYLDLSLNSFNDSQMPKFIGSMSSLRYLNLSEAFFTGSIPPHLGNLSNLLYLDLDYNFDMHSNDLSWLTRLSLLEYLGMSDINISTVANYVQIMAMLPSIKSIHLSYSQLQKPTISPLLSNLSNLITLDLSENYFEDPTSLNWVWNLTSLKRLDLSGTNLKGMLPRTFNNLCNMKELDLSYNYQMNIDITEFVNGLPQCLRHKLQSLNLHRTNLVGNLSSILEQMISLKTLDLSYNNLEGPIPYIIQATRLRHLDLRNNLLDGVISKNHFTNFRSLQLLYLYGNSLIIEQKWVPPISLRWVNLNSCKLGPLFPQWIKQLTNIITLEISNTSIVDKLPDWFWNVSTHLMYLALSNNQISGKIHKSLQFTSLVELYLNNNLFDGSIPPLPQSLTILDLSYNSISGSFPLNFVAPNLTSLLLRGNLLSGTIPESICQSLSLQFIDLSSNLFMGPLPRCWMDSNFTMDLFVLILSNNSISGVFPSFLKNCQALQFLDLSYNKLSGNLPSWIGGKFLQFLLLRSNVFSGDIPIQITKLDSLQFLDLGHNNFSGTIPQSINALNAMMKHTLGHYVSPLLFSNAIGADTFIGSLNLKIKGTSLEYDGLVLFITGIDLSYNSFSGGIPQGISSLTGLISLNLSGNQLIGNIPERIGDMQALESLDLSNNELFGKIPFSLSNLTSLSYLNLSYNNLSGRIPSGNQLQTLDDPSIYMGNSGLCGPPLSEYCPGDVIPNPQGSESKHDDDGSDKMSLYLGICIGFISGLWLVFCVFLFKKSFRVAYFRAFDDFYDWVYVFVVVNWKRVAGK